MKKEDKKLLIVGGLAGVIASLCCIGPVVIVLLGLGSVSAALSLGRFTWLFSSLAVIFLGIAVVMYLKKKTCCSVEGFQKNWKAIVLAFVILVVLLVLLKYWLAPILARMVYR